LAYPHLLSAGRIGSLELPNRTIMAPMGTGYADENGFVTAQLIAYHAARAAGGVGLNITEHTAISRGGLVVPNMLALYDDRFTEGLRRLCQAVHDSGGRLAVQLNHGGRQADPAVVGDLVCASEHRTPGGGTTARALSVEEIREIVPLYSTAAARAKEAGADGVELHFAHGYLGASFLSPLTNRRTDAYGGDTQRRCRFAREIIAEVQRLCGPTFPVWCRISADEFTEGGTTLKEAQRVAPILEAAGAQAIHVSAALGETAWRASAPYYEPRCNLAHLAEGIARTVTIPVIAVGKILFPDLAEDLLARGVCDFVALGRPLLADPDWLRKAAEGREADICPCIACNIGCLHRRTDPVGMCFCATNPRTGREWLWPAGPPSARLPRRVLVIGGGPAGMAAATILAEAGHQVELWEAGEGLGGAYALACVPPGKGDLRPFLDYQARRLTRSGVVVRLSVAATADDIMSTAPDVAIVAAGAEEPPLSLFPGATPENAARADDVLAGRATVGHRVVVIGGGRTGTETAHYLADRGCQVTLIELRRRLAEEIPGSVRLCLERYLEAAGVTCLTETEAVYLDDLGLVVMRDQRQEHLPADTVVLALPRRSRAWLAEDIHRRGIRHVRTAGDARRPGSVQDAVCDATQVARQLAAELNVEL